MITGGHIAASYLIAEGSKALGVPLDSNQVLGVVIAGNLPDLDFLVGLVNGRKGEQHHQNITHTPIGVLLMWLVIVILFKTWSGLSLVLLVTMIAHLFLDDLGHMAAKLGIYKRVANPQINWLYPFTPYSNHKLIMGTKDVLRHYLVEGWSVAVLEGTLIILALIVFLIKYAGL